MSSNGEIETAAVEAEIENKVDQPVPKRLVSDPNVCLEFNIHNVTLQRWTRDKRLNFPPPINILNRNFRDRDLLEAFKAERLKESLRDLTPKRRRPKPAPPPAPRKSVTKLSQEETARAAKLLQALQSVAEGSRDAEELAMVTHALDACGRK
jgi:hypothetical protein